MPLRCMAQLRWAWHACVRTLVLGVRRICMSMGTDISSIPALFFEIVQQLIVQAPAPFFEVIVPSFLKHHRCL